MLFVVPLTVKRTLLFGLEYTHMMMQFLPAKYRKSSPGSPIVIIAHEKNITANKSHTNLINVHITWYMYSVCGTAVHVCATLRFW